MRSPFVRGALCLLAITTTWSAGAGCSTTQPRPGSAAVERGSDAYVTPDAAANPRTATETSPEAALASKESRKVARTLVKVSELRGIASTKAVPGVKLTREQLVAKIKDKALREYPPEALRREGLLLQLFGFAPPTFDYLGQMMKLLEAQLEGFYEPKNGTMYLASELTGSQAQATLAHELVHALQDQRWDLRKRSDYKPGHGDEQMALACLAEGDATSLMLDFLMQPGRTALEIPAEAVRELMEGGMNVGDVQSVPHILRSTLVAPYMEGLTFVNQLRKKGGWSAVDRSWDTPPTTTEQILHLEKWESHERAIPIAAPTAAALGGGWTKDDEDSFGELGFALSFAEWIDADTARRVAAGWGGDRTAVYSKGHEIAYAIHLRYDAAAAPKLDALADRAFTALEPGLTKSLGKPALAEKTALCFERKELGPFLLARRGRDMVITAGPAKVDGSSWSSSSTCATAKRWADEVAQQP